MRLENEGAVKRSKATIDLQKKLDLNSSEGLVCHDNASRGIQATYRILAKPFNQKKYLSFFYLVRFYLRKFEAHGKFLLIFSQVI
jgi:hypothetical protein